MKFHPLVIDAAKAACRAYCWGFGFGFAFGALCGVIAFAAVKGMFT